MGHTTGNRLGVLARRPAPVQVHYLGYPGTTGAAYIDYFITDAIASPPELAAEFTEQLVYLPHCFMAGNGLDAENAGSVTRAEQGLPQEAVVFCNFAKSSRITRNVFALWMEILRAVPSGVLWLKQSHALTVKNLRTEAQRCGIAAERLIFAPRVAGKSAHLARVRLADLALDTIGWYNGHSSTSDMLWAGVPVLTAPGGTFASRVAASLSHAAGLPELVARDAQEYVQQAVLLGNDPQRCARIRSKLADNRRSAPFFDERGIVADLEAAYQEMWRLCCAGETPHAIRQSDG
jgi:predicted O-linked N-acetylglucosamine transferase (SPINDLY family)